MAKGKRWGLSDLDKLPPGMVQVNLPQTQLVKTNTAEKGHLGLMIYGLCQLHEWTYQTEVKFHPQRRFRFDWAIPEIMVAVEYEGLMSEKSGHTTIGGYSKDCEKYNLAQISGWTVLRYTAKTYQQATGDIEEFIKTKNERNG